MSTRIDAEAVAAGAGRALLGDEVPDLRFGHRGRVVELVVGDDVSGVERLPGAGRGADRATTAAGGGGADLGAVAETDGQHQDEHDPGHQHPGAATAQQDNRFDADGAGGEAPAGEPEDHQPPTAATSTRHNPSSPRTTYCRRSIRKRPVVLALSGPVMVRVADTSTTTVVSLPGGRDTTRATGVAGRRHVGRGVRQGLSRRGGELCPSFGGHHRTDAGRQGIGVPVRIDGAPGGHPGHRGGLGRRQVDGRSRIGAVSAATARVVGSDS